jgi:ADP-ribose pyrophosphatase YjhB (NUDIX family)
LVQGGGHTLTVEQAGQGLRARLEHSRGDRRSHLHDALAHHLRLVAGGAELTFNPGVDRVDLPAGAGDLVVLLGWDAPIRLAEVALTPAPRLEGEVYQLSPFESRFLGRSGFPHPVPLTHAASAGLRTDLHTHLAACVHAEDLVAIGLQVGARYRVDQLAEAGIRWEGEGPVALSELSETLRRRLAERLAVPLDERITFLDMERIYRLRSPITKHPDALEPLLRRTARDYAAMGVRYLELSYSNVVEAGPLALIHRLAPELREETGVDLRFLAAISRHDDLEWDLDYIERIQEVSASRYFVGVDFMGHETNSTRDFLLQLETLAEWAHREHPGFVIRVHAGENPAFPENVRVAVEAARGKDVQLRIGHGLYGVDDATLDLLRETATVVEFNLNSNFALNNIQSCREAPILRYAKAGVPLVLGTDGYGIYQSSLDVEARAAALSGLSEADLELVRSTEASVLDRRETLDVRHADRQAAFDVPPDRPFRHFVPQVVERNRLERAQQDRALLERLEAIEVPLLDDEALSALLGTRQVISFAGAWRKSWEIIAPADQAHVERELEALFEALDPSQVVLITGGTAYGVEGQVHRLARPRGFEILGTVVWETPPQSLTRGAISHAHVIGRRLHDKAAGLYQLVKEHGGLCVFIGGGNIVNDEIQTAANLRVPYLLMDGPAGASTLHAREQPQRAFTAAADIVRAIEGEAPWTSTNDPYWHLGANPTVDAVVTREHPLTGRREVLLIRRDEDAAAEPGKWAVPGGFQLTDAPRGEPWRPGYETALDALLREVEEETGLDLAPVAERLRPVGDYEGEGRDPRDTPEAWSRSSAYAVHLPADLAQRPIAGGDDACDARWIPLDELPWNMAFDHDRILRDALATLAKAQAKRTRAFKRGQVLEGD